MRVEALRLAEATEHENLRRAARALVAHTKPDPLAVWLVVFAGALLVVLAAYWIVQEHMGAPQEGQPRAPMSLARSIRAVP